jgi:hypothetical protein
VVILNLALQIGRASTAVALTVALTAGVYWAYLENYKKWLKHYCDKVASMENQIDHIRDKEKLNERYTPRMSEMLTMGTIFIAGAFILLGAAAQTRSSQAGDILALAAPIAYLLWLFTVQLTTRVMGDAELEARLLASSKNSTARFFRDLYGKGHGETSMMKIRRNHWLAYVPLLIGASILLIVY